MSEEDRSMEMDVDARDEDEAPEVPKPKEAKMKQLQRSQIRQPSERRAGFETLAEYEK